MRLACIVALVAMSACTPSFEYEGERVVVASNYRVCAGTLESFDRDVEYVEQRLGLSKTEDPLRITILDRAEVERSNVWVAYTTFRDEVRIMLPADRVDFAVTHEMVHARTWERAVSTPLFSEGIAVAVAPAWCPPHGAPPTLDELLAVQTNWDLSGHGYYAGGELVAWLLETHGSEQVLDFLSTLMRPEAATRSPDPEFVRASYRAHFGTELDDDIFAHDRDPEQLTAEQVGCIAPAAPIQGDRIHLQANLDCESRRVETDFRYSNRGFVDWTLEVPDSPSPRRYRLLDRLPPTTELKITHCACSLDAAGDRSVWTGDSSVGANIELEPGTYLVRWQGPLDEGLELDILIEGYDAVV